VSKAFSSQSLKDKDQKNVTGVNQRQKVQMINNRAESAKSNAYGAGQMLNNNINMSSAQPGEDGMLTGEASQMDAH
jgi:hypothetical protein